MTMMMMMMIVIIIIIKMTMMMIIIIIIIIGENEFLKRVLKIHYPFKEFFRETSNINK